MQALNLVASWHDSQGKFADLEAEEVGGSAEEEDEGIDEEQTSGVLGFKISFGEPAKSEASGFQV